MANIVSVIQIVIAVILIGLILLQQRGTGLGSAFGQESGTYSTQRGIQKKIFYATIVLAMGFVALAVYALFQQ